MLPPSRYAYDVMLSMPAALPMPTPRVFRWRSAAFSMLFIFTLDARCKMPPFAPLCFLPRSATATPAPMMFEMALLMRAIVLAVMLFMMRFDATPLLRHTIFAVAARHA